MSEEEQAEQQQETEVIDSDVDALPGNDSVTDEPEAGDKPEPDAGEPELNDEDEVIVTIGDSPPQESEEKEAPPWVRELRKSQRDTQKENRELKNKLEAINAPEKGVKLGAKPKLEDLDYDTDRYESELALWYETKRKSDQQEAESRSLVESQQKEWQQTLDSYQEKKSKLKVKNFDDSEEAVFQAFDETQQGIVIQGADNAALTFYALGRNEEKLKELAKIKDPVKFSFAVAKLEGQLKVKNRKAPPPERSVTGTAPSSGTDSKLNSLREEAERTGNYTKIRQYKAEKRKK